MLAVFSRGWDVGRGECDGNFSLKDHAQNLDSRWKLDEQFFREKNVRKDGGNDLRLNLYKFYDFVVVSAQTNFI